MGAEFNFNSLFSFHEILIGRLIKKPEKRFFALAEFLIASTARVKSRIYHFQPDYRGKFKSEKLVSWKEDDFCFISSQGS